ncbi:MAG TPA: amylo-alpha-1,6-glucosidase [Paracoccaceae bacterium]|nr:amylo-alpha-1,6-glucosidase [Paracoccaceae bacterium]
MDTIDLLRPQPEDPPGQHEVSISESLSERRARTLKHGDSFAVLDASGDIRASSVDGLYHCDTRHLSRCELTLGGVRPMLLSSTLRDDNAALICDLSNPDVLIADGDERVPSDWLHIRRFQFLWEGTLYERLRVRNFGNRPVRVPLNVHFEADFADIFEVRGDVRERHGTHAPVRVEGETITWSYMGLDGQERSTVVRFSPHPARIASDGIGFELDLPPGGSEILFIEVLAGDLEAAGPADPDAPAGPARFRQAMRAARRALRRTSSRAAAIDTSNEIFNEAARRSVADLYMLNTETPQGSYPYAGVPWFSTAFGRDALITAFQMLWMDAELARGVLRFLAANQATEVDPASDAEPGKILHETRRGEMAETGEVPFRRYYGSVDSTPLFVMLAGAYLGRTGDLGTMRELWPNLQAALAWMDRYGDRDGDGFLEYGRMTEEGLANQGWKDSHDSIFHADGALARAPIALCEVQAYAFGALRAAADIAAALGDTDEAAHLRDRAGKLAARFDAAFWCEDLGTYALALDGSKRPCRVRASNAGHALWTGIAAPERADRLARALMGPSSFSGWGVRTLAAGEARYNPMSYHDGSVWPHDNALIAAGLARYGYRAEAARIFGALFDASVYTELRRLPELFCGFPRLRGQGPTLYPVACSPQAWAAAAPIGLIAACLGLTFDSGRDRIEMHDPVLPGFLDMLTLRNVAIGDGRMDIVIRRAGEGITAHVLRRTGQARLLVTH